MPAADNAVAEEEIQSTGADEGAATEEQDQDEFDSGFSSEPTETPADAKKDEEPAPAEEKPAEPAPAVEYRQVTKAEWDELTARAAAIDQIKVDHAKKLDTAFGKVGGLERKLQELQQATPAGEAVEVTDDDVAELAAEFPELGGLVLKSLQKVAGKLKGTRTASAESLNPEKLEALVSTRVIELQAEELEDQYSNWREIVGKPDDKDNEYRKWLATQSAEYQQRVGSTYSAGVIARSIAKFQEHAAAAKAERERADNAAAAEAAKKRAAEDAANKRRERLDSAAQPKGAGGHQPDPTEDDFDAGFRSG